MHQGPGPRSARRPIILVVEDDAEVRHFLVDVLQAGATVLEAESGRQAVDLLDEHRGRGLDLLLVDYLLPERSGLEILRLTRERWPWIPTVIMTGVGSEDLAIEALRAGARDYLRKPIGLEELTQAVDALTTFEASAGPGARPLPGRRWGNQQPAPSHPLPPALHRAIAFVQQHFFEPITLADVARSALLSKFHFCRVFHHETGLSFRDYLQGLRIARAKSLLADTRLTVTEIAFAIGFNDLSYFDNVFAKIVGVTPTEYRKSPRLFPG